MTTPLKEICVMQAGVGTAWFAVEFHLFDGGGDPLLDPVIIKLLGDDALFPWAALGLHADLRDGYEPADYGGEIEADRVNARAIAKKLKASGFAVASHRKF